MPAGGTKEEADEVKVDEEQLEEEDATALSPDAAAGAVAGAAGVLVDKLTVVLGVKEVTFDVEGEEDEQEVDGG